MTETLLALIPHYGLWLILGVVTMACLGIPLPSSMIVMTAGGFAASDDLVLWQVFAITLIGFIIGDQLAFLLARSKGEAVLNFCRKRASSAKIVDKAENSFNKYGSIAIFLSRTILSPLGPYIAYISGAAKFSWVRFTVIAVIGAACWAAAYSYMGYLFASKLTQMSGILTNVLGFALAVALLFGLGYWLLRAWRKFKAHEAGERDIASPA